MKNKLSKGLSLSLSANPKHLIKGAFFAAQRVFAEFGVKNHTFGNTTLCVAVGNKVIDTRLPQPVGCGDKYDVSGLGSGLLRRCTPRNDVCSVGRSMIEMLGVLAIIAVLSVGGIAGYSKAMQKYKINKMLDDYTMLTTNILEHLDNLKYVSKNSSAIGMVDVLQASGIIPPSWKKMNSIKIWDSNGNLLALFSRNNEFGFSINIGGYRIDSRGAEIAEGFSQDICLTLFKDLIQPLHSQISKGYTYNTKRYIYYYGDNFCDGKTKKCLSNITLSEMKQACEICNGDTYCDISFMF